MEDQDPTSDRLYMLILYCIYVDKTHHNWSQSIPSAILPCPPSGGTWRCWDRPPSAAGRACRMTSSSGGLSSVERDFHCPGESPRGRCW